MAAAYSTSKDERVANRPAQQETQFAVWICLGTGCCIGEPLQARWRHVDLEKATWFVPRQNTKTKTHVDWHVYLSASALRQFKGWCAITGKTEWCFPATNRGLCLRAEHQQAGWRPPDMLQEREPLAHRRSDDSLVLADGKNGEWTPHDLRRTASTMMQALRISRDVIDRCQNHALRGSKVLGPLLCRR
jgi:integrase